MKQIVFVAVDDADVDLLSRIRQHDEMRVEAVYHPDPGSLVARLAALSHLPVVFDRGRLEGLTPDVCIGGDRAAELAAEWRERALLAGRPAPVFVPVDRVGEYLDDVAGFLARVQQTSGSAAPTDDEALEFEVRSLNAGPLDLEEESAVPSEPAPGDEPGSYGLPAAPLAEEPSRAVPPAAAPRAPEPPARPPAANPVPPAVAPPAAAIPVPPSAAPLPPPAAATPARPARPIPPQSATPVDAPPSATPPRAPLPPAPPQAAAPRPPEPVAPPRAAAPPPAPPAAREPEMMPPPAPPEPPAPPAARLPEPAGPPFEPEAEAATLGTPPIEVCYDPVQLVAWLSAAAARLLGGSAAVVWQRGMHGERYTLLGYAPSTLALPALPTPPRLLEELARAGRPQVVSSARLFAGVEMLVPLSLVTVPLPGTMDLFGLLGVFRPDTDGAVPAAALNELARHAPELGQALDRCYRFADMGQELKRLRFRDRLRDFMLGGRFSAPGRWEEMLALVLEAAPAAAAYVYRLDPVSARLELTAVGGDEEMGTGHFSVPMGRGFIGSAFQREGVTVYSRDGLDDLNDAHDLYLMPLRARRAGLDVPLALLMLDGVASRTLMGQETTAFLEELGGIVGPFLE